MIMLSDYDDYSAKMALVELIAKFCGTDSDIEIILKNRASTMKFGEVLRLLESSLSIQREELDRHRKALKRAVKHIDTIAQNQLL